MTESVVLNCHQLSKSYQDGSHTLQILHEMTFSLSMGEKVAIIGPSGSGKSTLLHLLGGLDKPTKGSVYLQKHCLNELNEAKKCQLRNQYLGFVYQFHHLLPDFTALENVAMPLWIRNSRSSNVREEAKAALEAVGLAERVYHRPGELSGGERQRVAIARALVTKPQCILADEPTGNLDSDTANHIIDLFFKLNQVNQTAFVIVTHDHAIANKMDRVLTLNKGCLVSVER